MNQHSSQKDPQAALRTAEALLDEGDPNLAMAYFANTGENYAETGNWERAGYCFSRAAYCYEVEGRYEKAAEDYERAADFYEKAELPEKASGARLLVHAMRSKA